MESQIMWSNDHFLCFTRFEIVGYGCMTCIGNSGPLPEEVAGAIEKVVACQNPNIFFIFYVWHSCKHFSLW